MSNLLGSLSEQRGNGGGSSADSLNGDPSVIKKKKDQINHSKQKALRVLSGELTDGAGGGKALVKKTRSAPGRTQQLQPHEGTVAAASDTSASDTSAAAAGGGHDNETDTDNDEIMERDAAIAMVIDRYTLLQFILVLQRFLLL